MTYTPRPFYYTQRFCITAIFTVIATVIVLSGSGIFHPQSQLHAAKNSIEPAVTKDAIAKAPAANETVTEDKAPAATDKKVDAAKAETKPETKADDKTAVKEADAKESAEPGDKNRIRNISFDTVVFDMKKGDNFERKMLTPAIEKLHGKKVSIGGWILPSGENEITDGFFLTRDNKECCFGPGAILYDRIYVVLKPEVVLKYVTKSVRVTGRFEIEYVKDPIDHTYMAIYQLSDVEVK